MGAIQGCNPPDNTRACPLKSLTRAEAFKILVVAGQAYGVLLDFPNSLMDRFIDDDEMWDGAVSRLVNFLADQLIIDECNPSDNTGVCPEDSLTRAQVAKVVAGTFGLTAPDDHESPRTDTEGAWYEPAARIGGYHGLWDTTTGQFDGGEEIDGAEFARVVVTAGGDDFCADNPFTAAREADIEAGYPGQTLAAYAYDTRSGCAFWMNPDERLRTASVFKVMVMAGTLLEAQNEGREVTSWEMSQLEPMIPPSANPRVRVLWRRFGASPWFSRQVGIFGLDQTNLVGDTHRVWGRTTTSARDQGNLICQLLLGHWGPLDDDHAHVTLPSSAH